MSDVSTHTAQHQTTQKSFTAYVKDGIAWMDARGRGAWIALMVLGFIAAGPFGLVILGYLLFTGRMGKSQIAQNFTTRHYHTTSGNSAFDAYRNDVLKRLEDEQEAFQGFLERLREAKDKAEFDQFMDERQRETIESRK